MAPDNQVSAWWLEQPVSARPATLPVERRRCRVTLGEAALVPKGIDGIGLAYSIQSRNLLGTQSPSNGTKIVPQLVLVPCTNDHAGHSWPLQQPVHGADAEPYWHIYQQVAEHAGSTTSHAVQKQCPHFGVTEHPLDTSRRVVVLVNYAPAETVTTVTLSSS